MQYSAHTSRLRTVIVLCLPALNSRHLRLFSQSTFSPFPFKKIKLETLCVWNWCIIIVQFLWIFTFKSVINLLRFRQISQIEHSCFFVHNQIHNNANLLLYSMVVFKFHCCLNRNHNTHTTHTNVWLTVQIIFHVQPLPNCVHRHENQSNSGSLQLTIVLASNCCRTAFIRAPVEWIFACIWILCHQQ